jgi:2-polyprenyl-6-methoxyphenol hydroxylase-like FAD-dependent oxidoreductase
VNLREISIAVIGGGIGGLAAALALGRAGFDVGVYEQAREVREVGAGIQLSWVYAHDAEAVDRATE